jgi:prolyl-tRNA synthetase
MPGRSSVLTSQAHDFPRWYQEIVAKAELADNGPVRGTMVIRPYGYAIWERMQSQMDQRIKAAGAQNAYFPLFIPQGHLQREAEHVEGFSPELAVVTIAGGKPLEEPIVVRPTSETVVGEYLSKWVQSYRDLPLLLNQWANVVRWELRPRLFLRTSEFLWQEGHTAHASAEDARAYAARILREAYADFMVNVLAIPVHVGRKSPAERFAGAVNTLTCEAMTRDGKALQMGTSHELGQNFARAFDISYLSASGSRELAWTTSWGTSTRMIGGLIMVHGDDHGLRVPPLVAPIQAVVIAIRAEVVHVAASIVTELQTAGVRARLDDRVDVAFGRRAVDWELKGVPVRVEIGPREAAVGIAMLVSRWSGERTARPLTELATAVPAELESAHAGLLAQARRFRDARTRDVPTVADAVESAADGWARIPWAVCGEDGERRLAESGLTIRCLQNADGGVPADNEQDVYALIARAY